MNFYVFCLLSYKINL